MTKGWYGNKQAHSLASKGIKTIYKTHPYKAINMDVNIFEDDNIPHDYAEVFGFEFDKTVVHGTSLENATKIKEDGWLRDGTYVHSGYGGFSDSYTWAKNSFDNPVVIMVEVDQEEPLKRGMFGLGWITLGKRGKEREGMDTVIDKLKVKKMVIFKVPETEENWYGTLKEIKI